VVRHFLESTKYAIKSACFGVPGPVKEGKCKLTNVPWEVIDAEILAA